ncbi:endoplasmic reticulum metallopeptidase 1-like [Condylostylus longicornis]|uniref:endoplasmic reticulum metallopeptidase 1-like n=1 Tax=Condylostylus longicornis TaxID=2530218 RepID=UPI00244DCA02|nr:endoplasmic reticulum metallopeptidase 1-like [Condylostylus longicornis]
MKTADRVYKDRGSRSSVFHIGYGKKNVHNISEIYGIITLIVVILLGILTRWNYKDNLPKALSHTDLMHKSATFLGDRAWRDLRILTSFGTRPTGSYANEILTVDFLKREFGFISQNAHKNQKLDIDVQVVSGSYYIPFKPHGMTNVYRNVQNVIMKINGQTNHTLMLNCHFDTVAGSTGAGDDGAMCCVMLEILRVLSRQPKINKHNILFLFNGAEETPLQASHGFITQHKWAKNVKAFINLESVGSGGKELLFQSGPNHPWLIKMYARAAAHPNAQAAAEEIFQSGLIPSDTDFRIFRDFGNIPGLDFAHAVNGYRYHTKFDHIDFISKNVIQNTGDNILELTKIIANSKELGETYMHSQGTEVYFDILGLIFVSYSKDFAKFFNNAVVILSIVLPYLFLSKATRGINKKHLRYEIIFGFLINTICLVSSNVVGYSIAYDLDINGHSMAWYSNTSLAIATYCVVSVLVQCVVHVIFNNDKSTPLSLGLKTQARLCGSNLFWGLLTAAITLADYRIGYVFMVPLLITLITNIITGLLDLHNTIMKWLYVHIIGQVFVVLWTTHFYTAVMEVFIPIAGRSGGLKNPDILIGIICCSLTFFIMSCITPLVILLRRYSNLFITLLVIYIVTRCYILGVTHYGFPYRDDSNGAPAVQRHFIAHTVRTLYDSEGNVRYTDSGFWFREADRNAKKTIESLAMPETPIPQDQNILCENEVFCGLPFYSSRQLHTGGYWVPGPAPLVRELCQFKLTNRSSLTPKIHRLNFSLSGSYVISLQIRPKESVKLKSWSFLNSVPNPNIYNKQKAYFVMITHGLEANGMNITIDFETNNEKYTKPLVDISVVTWHWEYYKEHTPTFANILAKVPKWAFAVPSVASLTAFTF